MNQAWVKLVGHITTPRNLATLLAVFIFVFILVHLILTMPLSHSNNRLRYKSLNGRAASTVLQFQSNTKEQSDVFSHKHSVPDGEGVWIEGRDIQVITAISDMNYPNTTGPRIMLPSLLKHSVDRDFVCCFISSSKSTVVHELPSFLDYIDLRYLADYQNAVFSCPPPKMVQLISVDMVAFAAVSCMDNITKPLKITFPKRRSFEFAVCTKVAYQRIEPVHLLEWFEFMKEMGVSKVVTFHNNLHRDSKKVFDYYVTTGLLELIHYTPRFARNYYSEANSQRAQSRHEKSLVVRDCQYRLGGYDFVLTIDFDELPVPQRPYGSINWVLQDLRLNNKDVAAFNMTPILMPPVWNPTSVKTNSLYHWGFESGTHIGHYCIKWAYMPDRTWVAATHEHLATEPYKHGNIPESMMHFLHFRNCKSGWTEIDCDHLKPTVQEENSLHRFTNRVMKRLDLLPLDALISDQKYIRMVHSFMERKDQQN